MNCCPTRGLLHVLVLIACLARSGFSQDAAAGAAINVAVIADPPPSLPAPQPPNEGAPESFAPAMAVEDPFLSPPPSLIYEEVDGRRWSYPWTWIPLDGWTNSAELGINGSSGNANSLSFQAGTRFKRKTDVHRIDMRVTHNRTQTNGIEKQHNALFYADFDRYFGDSPWYLFAKHGVEYDRFKAFDLRYNFSTGLAYHFIKSEDLSLKGRFGSGTSREFGGPEDRWVPEALFGGDYEHQLNKRNKWIARADYFPEWGNFSNYRIVSDASWEMLWDETGNLSFKIGAIDRYDSTPNGRQPNDLTYSMLLLYKF